MGNRLAFIEVGIAVTVWGASFVATKIALTSLSPAAVVWLRFAMGVVVMGAVMLRRRQFSLPAQREVPYLAVLGFLGISFHQWLQSTALLTTRATNSAWIVATIPIFMALLGWLVLRERLIPIQALGILVAALGVLLIVTTGDWTSLAAGKFGTIGDVLMLISAVNWAVFSALSRRGLKAHPAAWMMFYVMLFGWLFISVLFFSGPGISEIRNVSRDSWLAILFLGVICSGLAYVFWYDGLQKLPVAQVGSFLYFEPLVTVVVAAWLLGEPFPLVSALGGGAILIGVWLVTRVPVRSGST